MKEIRAIIYIRVSTAEQAVGGTSLSTQREACLKYAESKGAFAVKVCEDAGVSGAKYETRPGLQEALRLIETGEANTLFVWKLDRLARSTRIALQVAERIDRAGGLLISVGDGQEFGKSPSGRLLLSLLATVAEMERSTIRERSITGRKARAAQGVQTARTTAPLGYYIIKHSDKAAGRYPDCNAGEYIVKEDEAKIACEIFQQYAAGSSLRALGRQLLAKGHHPPKGGIVKDGWNASTLLVILRNPVYKGQGSFGRREMLRDESRITERGLKSEAYTKRREQGDIVTFPVPALVSEDLWDACQRRLDRNQDVASGRADRRYMLRGMIFCPQCGHRLAGKKSDGEFAYYVCPQKYCGHRVAFRADRIENAVVESLEYLAQHPQNLCTTIRAYDKFRASQGPGEVEKRRQELQTERTELDAKGSALARAQVAALMAGATENDFAPLYAELRQRREAIDRELSSLPLPEAMKPFDAESVAQKLARVIGGMRLVLSAPDMTAAQKQAILVGIIERVTPERLTKETGHRGPISPDYAVTTQLLSSAGLTVHTIKKE